jgi:hypothetical protein
MLGGISAFYSFTVHLLLTVELVTHLKSSYWLCNQLDVPFFFVYSLCLEPENQISPRQGLLRVREFTLAEIEHFVDPEDKSHQKFVDVSDLEFLMFPRELQLSGESAKLMKLGDAVSKVCIFWQFFLANLVSFLSFFCLYMLFICLILFLIFHSIILNRELLIMRHLVTSLEGSIFS